MSYSDFGLLLLVSLVWGITNSLISKSSKQGYGSVKGKIAIKNQFFYLLKNPLYTMSVSANLAGSLIFFYGLQNKGNMGNDSNSITSLYRNIHRGAIGKFFDISIYSNIRGNNQWRKNNSKREYWHIVGHFWDIYSDCLN